MKALPESTIFPIEMRALLRRCARIDPASRPGESYERTKILDAAIQTVQFHCPQFFREEQFDESKT